MKALAFLSFALGLLLGSCEPVNTGDSVNTGSSEAPRTVSKPGLERLLRKLPVVPLPLRYDLREEAPPSIELEPMEQQLVSGDPAAESGIALGILPDTSQVIHVLWLAAADSWLPMISTFKRSGELLKVEGLIIGQCAPWDEPCFKCKETMSIDANYRVLATDTVRECECDTAYTEVVGTCKRYVNVLTGLITNKGVMMSPIRRAELPEE